MSEHSRIIPSDPPAALVIHPGDTLLIVTRGPLSARAADMYRRTIMAQAPALAGVVVIEAEAVAAYRDGVTPAYVTTLLESLLTGAPLDFRGASVPADVRERLERALGPLRTEWSDGS